MTITEKKLAPKREDNLKIQKVSSSLNADWLVYWCTPWKEQYE